jgi:hypothetical protein
VTAIDCDYLVIGAGAAGMAFTDALISASDVDVVVVDRRSRPGGHWIDAYPFVRLHQPSATYGVNSRPLGNDTIDESGPNAGLYERATGLEICAYFEQVMDHVLLGSGKVRFFPMCDYVSDGGPRLVSRLTGNTTEVRVRRRIVDGTYLQVSVPATHQRSFTADGDAHVIPVGELTSVDTAPAGYTILGSGKTAMDACTWILDNGADPDQVRWIRPRDPWLVDRTSVQPADLLGGTIEGFGVAVEALAGADSVPDLFATLEASGQVLRLDRRVDPTMFRGAIVTQAELGCLQQVERVVRHGHVSHVGTDRIVMTDGEIPTTRAELHVDCTARGIGSTTSRPIFADDRITLQSLTGGFTTYNAALVGFIEATRDSDVERNRLCPPTPPPSAATDWIAFYRSMLVTSALHGAEPDLALFQEEARLSLTCGLAQRLDDPQIERGAVRSASHAGDALRNADRLLDAGVA